MSGVFITFEGVEGCGKSTQVHLLAEALQTAGRKVYVTREPGGTRIGESIRAILLDAANTDLCKKTEVLLYAASRAQHVAEVIHPKLAEGMIVISDRYADATTAYQGAARGFTPAQLKSLHTLAADNLQPHLTIVLDVPVADGLSRVLQRSIEAGTRAYDRLESESIDFHERVRIAYLALAHEDPDRIRVLDGASPAADIHNDVMALVKPLCGLR
jgi:dTMP kinase